MDKVREEFEAWYEEMTGYPVEFGEDGNPSPIGGPLSHNITLGMWVAWKASRAALCVDLPKQWFDDGLDSDLMEANRVLDALDDAGVRYK